MFESDTAYIVVMEKKEPKKTIRELVYQRVRLGLCIHHADSSTPTTVDGPEWCVNGAVKRGVCDKHAAEFVRRTANLPDHEYMQIQNRLSFEGQLLWPQQVRGIKKTSPLSSIVKQVRGNAS